MLVPAAPKVNLVDCVMVRDLWTDTSRSKVRTHQFDNYSQNDVLVVTIRRRYLEQEHVKVGWGRRWPKTRWPKMTNTRLPPAAPDDQPQSPPPAADEDAKCFGFCFDRIAT